MSSGGPPPGPPPSASPPVPDGWLAKYDTNYNTYYYLNLATGKSQWEMPPGADLPPAYSATQDQRQQLLMYVQEQQPRRSGTGAGTGMALGEAGGLVGGVVLPDDTSPAVVVVDQGLGGDYRLGILFLSLLVWFLLGIYLYGNFSHLGDFGRGL
ncbi:hypothetical protein V1520DRAFT_84444 [Lipomyces starkeyi]|uniref:WW domain-containing protein n=1 Tax=Lipomyces starkeyi NRRL Y-11557 TaxID=675824 RepID=A0A1E3PU70_LIPST|nr:hypothetical protein LIPSTDRAFT_76704 [Lipomyces starkeyi NRRL Y-11557]